MNKKVFFIFIFALFWFFDFQIINAQDQILNTNIVLKYGDKNEYVTELQRLLNKDPETRITKTGVGSPGNESDFFGILTKAAVSRFQYKYKTKILEPLGLTSSTGIAGNKTILQLISLYYSDSINISDNSGTNNLFLSLSGSPVIDKVTPLIIKSGDTVVVEGKNFALKNNEILVGFAKESFFAKSKDGKTLSFVYKSLIEDSLISNFGKNCSIANSSGCSKDEKKTIDKICESMVGDLGDPEEAMPVSMIIYSNGSQSNDFVVNIKLYEGCKK
jgi:hypothetical protein